MDSLDFLLKLSGLNKRNSHIYNMVRKTPRGEQSQVYVRWDRLIAWVNMFDFGVPKEVFPNFIYDQ